jgi:hypothetical protein
MFRLEVRIIAALIACLGGQFALAEKPTADDMISRLPDVSVPGDGSAPFLIRGHSEIPGMQTAYEFEILWDGARYRAAMIDSADGVPLLFSSADELLVYDVLDGVILRVAPGRFHMLIAQSKQSPGSFQLTHQWDTGGPNQLRPAPSIFYQLHAPSKAIRRLSSGRKERCCWSSGRAHSASGTCAPKSINHNGSRSWQVLQSQMNRSHSGARLCDPRW